MLKFLLILLVVGCSPTAPFIPPPSTAWTPPPAMMDSLWREMERCSGLAGDWRQIQWFIVEERFEAPMGRVQGLWEPPHNIYLVEPNYPAYLPWPKLIQHEMLHDLTGSGSHGTVFDTCQVRNL